MIGDDAAFYIVAGYFLLVGALVTVGCFIARNREEKERGDR